MNCPAEPKTTQDFLNPISILLLSLKFWPNIYLTPCIITIVKNDQYVDNCNYITASIPSDITCLPRSSVSELLRHKF
jgi:hypothetical protein